MSHRNNDHYSHNDRRNNYPQQNSGDYRRHPSHDGRRFDDQRYNDRRGFDNYHQAQHRSFSHQNMDYQRHNIPRHEPQRFHQPQQRLRDDLRPSDNNNFRDSGQISHQSSNSSSSGPPMDLQSRTLKVTSFHKNVTKDLLHELFLQIGPVKNVVLRTDHAFIEFADADSVSYALAAMDGIEMFGKPLLMEPKIRTEQAFVPLQNLRYYQERPELFQHATAQ